MEQSLQPKDIVNQLFIATDRQDWAKVESLFADEVLLDYSSMGSPANTLKPKQITDEWKTILPGFDHTHHQIGNIQQTILEESAEVFAYGTATHFLEDDGGRVWTVVGTYDFSLTMENGLWRIRKMKFNFKYQDGNLELPQKAMNVMKGISNEESIGERNKSTVVQFFKTLEAENANEIANLFDEKGIHKNPYHSDIFPKGAKGKEAIMTYWEPAFQNFDGMRFHLEELYAMEDPNIVFVKFQGKIKLKEGEGFYENEYYSTFKFNEVGKIIEYVEIFNPILAAKSFGLLDQIK